MVEIGAQIKIIIEITPSKSKYKCLNGEFTCYNCGKLGHIAKNCRNKYRTPQENDTEESIAIMKLEINLITGSEG